jgi:multiple sugar transport system permease protein
MKYREMNSNKKKNPKQKKICQKETRTAWLLLLPSLFGISAFILIPFMDVIRRSFYEAMSGKLVGFSNYITVIQNEAFQLAVLNTLRFIVICIPVLLLLSLFLSVLIYGRKRHREFFKMSFLLPMAIPVASVVLLWKVFFNYNGLLNGAISMMGGRPIDWMNSSSAFYVLVFSYLWKNIGYDMVLWMAGLDGISHALYEAASIDGAGTWKKFRYITLPGLLPTVFILTVLSLINSFKVFREAYLVAGSYPNRSIYLLQHLFNNWFVQLDIQKMCAAVVIVVVILLIFVILIRNLGKKEEEEIS